MTRSCLSREPSAKVLVVTNTTDKNILEQLLRPLRRGLSAELAALLLHMQADDEVQARYEDLAERSTQGQLTPTEQEELALLVRANALLSVMKAEARVILCHAHTGTVGRIR